MFEKDQKNILEPTSYEKVKERTFDIAFGKCKTYGLVVFVKTAPRASRSVLNF